MAVIPFNEVVLGLYLGLLAGIFPAFVAFSLGFSFKYFTDVTIPGLGVVAMSAAIAGVSGGLMGLLDPELAESWIGITAIVVILMLCLWAHAAGDKLGAETPSGLTMQRLRESRLSVDLVERVDQFGHIRVRPIGEINDFPGYPPLPQDTRDKLKEKAWTFPAELSRSELEHRLEERLFEEFELTEVAVTIDSRGRAEISAAPASARLSRRVPPGFRGVSIDSLLPTGVARGDRVALALPDGIVIGAVLGARTLNEQAVQPTDSEHTDADGSEEEVGALPSPTTTGGEGRVTLSLPPEEARRVLQHSFAPMHVLPRGLQPEYESIAVLTACGHEFSHVFVSEQSPLVGRSLRGASTRAEYGTAVLAIKRGRSQLVGPSAATVIEAGDRLTVVGAPSDLEQFQEAVA